MKISEKDLHPHLRKRMKERGVSFDDINITLEFGNLVDDAKIGTFGKKYVFTYNSYWEKIFYKFKEVYVYYKLIENKHIVLTVIARYGDKF
ncbi:DUF4258 domain-containing protein [Calditrichota bacterium]